MIASRRSYARTVLAVLILLAPVGAPAVGQAPPPEPPEDRSSELWSILDDYCDLLAEEDPLSASRRGDVRFNDRLPDPRPEAVEARLSARRELADRLTAIDAESLSPADRLDAELLAHELETAFAAARFHPEQTPITSITGPQIYLPQLADIVPLSTRQHHEDYLARLEAIPEYLDALIEQMGRGMAAGRVPPRITVAGAGEASRAVARRAAEAPQQSPFYKPFAARPEGDEQAVRARRVIAEEIAPAYRRLADFLATEYVPAARESIAASESVDGPDWYAHALRRHTTTDLSAEEIHEVGLAEVARIRAEMLETIGRSDYPHKDDLSGDALLEAFLEYLRTNERFYHDSPEALLAGYREIAKRIDGELPKLFALLPRLPYGVRAMPAHGAERSPTAYYYPGSLEAGLAGYFVANTSLLDQRPTYEMVALTLHEAVPGHHLQIAIAQELQGQHPFRRTLGHTAFVEGWALYAERLGLEMGERPLSAGGRGLYDDPYDDFGRLTYEMWRACRLVVDTGMHAMGWSRERAIEFMRSNTALSERNIVAEVDRYIGWPAQATGYKIGELKIRELRAHAEAALGEQFDVRGFHEAVLAAGALPLDVLERRIEQWVATYSAVIDPHPR